MEFQRGDVVLVPFPFSDLDTTKVRSAVVVSGSLYHATEPDLILSALTSMTKSATSSLDYVPTDWQVAGLRFSSARKPVRITLDPARVAHQIGALIPSDLAEVHRRLRLALEL